MKTTIRKFAFLVAALSTLPITAVRAECYGDAATMYGCGTALAPSKTTTRQGNLEHFGDAHGQVLPDIASPQEQSASDVITPQESKRMLRSIVLGATRRSYSERAFMQVINNSGRPVRRSGSINQGGGR